MTAPAPRAVVLLSGGLDSATVLAIANDLGYDTYALSFRYGQRHGVELAAAAAVAAAFGVCQHRTIDVDLGAFGGSALTDPTIAVPRHDDPGRIGEDIPVTYVPARNTIFLAFALAWAEVLDADAIFIGVNALDYSGYPDCRPAFLAAFQQMARLATRAGVTQGGNGITVKAPLLHMTKVQIIRRGLDLGVDYALTHSCYDPDGVRPCGGCDSCLLRVKGFAELGLTDPALAVAR